MIRIKVKNVKDLTFEGVYKVDKIYGFYWTINVFRSVTNLLAIHVDCKSFESEDFECEVEGEIKLINQRDDSHSLYEKFTEIFSSGMFNCYKAVDFGNFDLMAHGDFVNDESIVIEAKIVVTGGKSVTEKKETSFMDLSDDVIFKIFSYLDLHSMQRVRVNKRLLELSLRVKHTMKSIILKMALDDYLLVLCTSTGTYHHYQSDDFVMLEKKICRMARNTYVENIQIGLPEWDTVPSEEHSRVVEAFFNFEADELSVMPHPCADELNTEWNLPQLNLSSLLILVNNVKDICIGLFCTSLTVQDLCTLRQTMLQGECKLEKVDMMVEKELSYSFFQSCFGIIIESTGEKPTYQINNESIELYSDHTVHEENVHLVEGNFKTSLRFSDHGNGLCFVKQSEDSSY